MKLLIFPLTLGMTIIIVPVLAAIVDMALLGNSDPKFNVWRTVLIVSIFASICALPATIATGLLRVLVRARIPAGSVQREFLAAILAGGVILGSIYAIIAWKIPVGGMAGLVMALPFASFLIGWAMLIAMYRSSAREHAGLEDSV